MPSSLSRLTLVLGGARSGKSRYAEDLVQRLPPPWLYVATAEALDDEMRDRIAGHKGRRGEGWTTVEAPRDLVPAIATHSRAGHPILIDCLTLWLSNILLADRRPVEDACAELYSALSAATGPIVVVSNEVGQGVVPETSLGRDFRDAQGRLNAEVAAIADHVVLMVAGLPLVLKQP